VPHEVLPASSERYAITLWYYDGTELEAARSRGENVAGGAKVERGIEFCAAVQDVAEALTTGKHRAGLLTALLEPPAAASIGLSCGVLLPAAGDEAVWLTGREEGWGCLRELRKRTAVVMDRISARIPQASLPLIPPTLPDRPTES